jgi:hypothetical protein
MPFVPSAIPGPIMEWSEVSDNFRDLRTWLNAIPLVDFEPSAVQREHIVRPTVGGFPNNGTRSGFQSSARGLELGLSPPTPRGYERWGALPERFSISPATCRGLTLDGDEFARTWTPIGKTEHYPVGRRVRILCQFDCQVRSLPAGPYYPTGGGAGDMAGYFCIVQYNRDTDQEFIRGLRWMYPLEHVGLPGVETETFIDPVVLAPSFAVTEGTHDFALVYYRGVGETQVRQLDLTCVSFHIRSV